MASYTHSLFSYQRRPTREVKVGDVGVGGSNPIRVQSMTISDTMDTPKVVSEAIGLIEAGCEIVRITAPTVHHAENLKNIRDTLRQKGFKTPLVADIHFTPQAAMIAADYVEKVRINPGNYADRKLFAVKEYTDVEYQAELDHMAEKFIPLVRKCKANGVAMRIGTNHGSLSDRIMNRYGDTPLGMVESALEFVRLCEAESYQELIISMKASSPFVMIEAYRMLAQRMAELGMDYPFHLGVTEAGEGEDGRIKSAIGIGSLLEDGIGDTVRVSLTEDSIYEIPVAQQLVKKFNEARPSPALRAPSPPPEDGPSPRGEGEVITWNPMERRRRVTRHIFTNGLLLGQNYSLGVVISLHVTDPAATQRELEAWVAGRKSEEPICDVLFLQPAAGLGISELVPIGNQIRTSLPKLKLGLRVSTAAQANGALASFDAVSLQASGLTPQALLELAQEAQRRQKLLEVVFPNAAAAEPFRDVLQSCEPLLLSLVASPSVYEYRKFTSWLDRNGIDLPLLLRVDAGLLQEPILEASSLLGSLLMDGMGDAIEIQSLPPAGSIRLAFNILQATRLRISKAEFIACPSCGRTLFDLQTTTQRIKTKTGHLKGVKIAIMGCIVNGPGEMADADFGYVGGGPGRIHLYVGKECVEKNIPSEIADEKLIELIKSYGQWVEPPAA